MTVAGRASSVLLVAAASQTLFSTRCSRPNAGKPGSVPQDACQSPSLTGVQEQGETGSSA